jgi:hypothetical protein
MSDLFGGPRRRETRLQRSRHLQPLAALEIGREPFSEISLPPRTQGRVSIARFAKLQIDEPIENRGAIVHRRAMLPAPRADEGRATEGDGEKKWGATFRHCRHLKK